MYYDCIACVYVEITNRLHSMCVIFCTHILHALTDIGHSLLILYHALLFITQSVEHTNYSKSI